MENSDVFEIILGNFEYAKKIVYIIPNKIIVYERDEFFYGSDLDYRKKIVQSHKNSSYDDSYSVSAKMLVKKSTSVVENNHFHIYGR